MMYMHARANLSPWLAIQTLSPPPAVGYSTCMASSRANLSPGLARQTLNPEPAVGYSDWNKWYIGFVKANTLTTFTDCLGTL